jgi:dTDP-4-amino-4,6-dideoxygalactose transaminase
MVSTSVPFVDLGAQYLTIKPQIDEAIERVIASSAFVGGDDVSAFEAEFAQYCAVGSEQRLQCAACGNGTDSIQLILRAMGIGQGDEVITVAHTFTATAEAIEAAGARPVFVDIRPDTLLMDPNAIESAITPHTKAIMPVHLYGQPCDMDRIMAIARQHNLKVIEDAAQAHGATWRGQRPGALGDAASFSFYPGKNLGAYGDGGAVVSADEDLIGRVRMMSDHGRLDKYTHKIAGMNSRLDGLQAAILRVKLRHLDQWNAARQRRAGIYAQLLQRADLDLPFIDPNATSVWHLFAVRTTERAQMQERLRRHDIASGVHYPLPLHLQPAYRHLGVRAGSLPVTEQAANEVLSLPMYAELPEDSLVRVVLAVMGREAKIGELGTTERATAGVGVAAG